MYSKNMVNSAFIINCLFVLTVLVVLSVILSVSGCGSEKQPEDSIQFIPADTREGRWLQDLDFLATELPLRHINLFFQLSQQEWEDAVHQLKLAVPELTDEQITLEMAKIVAKIGDGHTNLRIWDNNGAEFHLYPLSIYWFSNGPYVVMITQEYSEALRSRILQIGNMDIDQVYEEVSSYISHENEAQLRNQSPRFMVSAELIHLLGISDETDRARFLVETEIGDTLELYLPALSIDEHVDWVYAFDEYSETIPLYRKNPHLFYWYEYLEETQTLYFQYNCCAMMQPPFGEFTDDLLEFMDSHQIERFIFDLRNNGGGNSMIAEQFIAELKNRPEINRHGYLFVITGRRTFSSAILNALRLRNNTNAILIGEATGGKPNHYGEVRSFNLPNSNIEVSYSTNYFTHSEDDLPSLIPDIFVELTSEDFFREHDPVLEAILVYEE